MSGEDLALDAWQYEDLESAKGTRGLWGLRTARLVLQGRAGRIEYTDVTPRDRAREMAAEISRRLEGATPRGEGGRTTPKNLSG